MMYNFILNQSGSDIVKYGLLGTDWFYDGQYAHPLMNSIVDGSFYFASDLYQVHEIFTYPSFNPAPKTPFFLTARGGESWNDKMSTDQDALFKQADISTSSLGSPANYMAITAYANERFTNAVNDPDANPYLNFLNPQDSTSMDIVLYELMNIIRGGGKYTNATDADCAAFRTKMTQTWGLQTIIDQVNTSVAESGM